MELGDAPNRTRINLWVSPSTYKFLEYVSQRDSRSMSDVIREALRDYAIKDKEFSEIVNKIDAKVTRSDHG